MSWRAVSRVSASYISVIRLVFALRLRIVPVGLRSLLRGDGFGSFFPWFFDNTIRLWFVVGSTPEDVTFQRLNPWQFVAYTLDSSCMHGANFGHSCGEKRCKSPNSTWPVTSRYCRAFRACRDVRFAPCWLTRATQHVLSTPSGRPGCK